MMRGQQNRSDPGRAFLTRATGRAAATRSGDAYFCVAGAPDPTDPVEQALRCAHMALDMVAATREHTAPDGSELQIRVGIHVGPVMAGCVGSKLPFWTLFGDTVRGGVCP